MNSPSTVSQASSSSMNEVADRTVLWDHVIIPLPPSAALFDVKYFLRDFKPGFGRQYNEHTLYNEQATLCTYSRYPNVISACVEVPEADVEAFQEFVGNNLFFGKYKTVAEVLMDNHDITTMMFILRPWLRTS